MTTQMRCCWTVTDPFLYLHNLAVFSNDLTCAFFRGTDLDVSELVYKYGPILSLNREEALELVGRSLEVCEEYSDAMRNELMKIRQGRSNRITVQKDLSGRWVRVS